MPDAGQRVEFVETCTYCGRSVDRKSPGVLQINVWRSDQLPLEPGSPAQALVFNAHTTCFLKGAPRSMQRDMERWPR